MHFLRRHLIALLAFFSMGANAAVLPGWHTNFVVAHSQAKAEGKLMLVHFSGSDWCGWCIKLQKEVFQKSEFKEYAMSNLVLVAVDFPKRKAMAPSAREANQTLAGKYQVEGFPTLLVLDSDAVKLGVVAFGDGGPKSFIKELEKVVAQSAEALASTGRPVSSANAAKANAATRGGLQLQGIVAKKGRRVAQINNETLSPGQSAKVRIASGEVSIRCLEIRDASVIVRVEGRKEPLELRLAQRL